MSLWTIRSQLTVWITGLSGLVYVTREGENGVTLRTAASSHSNYDLTEESSRQTLEFVFKIVF
ncbi:MAG: hypothetical protein K2J18_02265 [Paramuribaculum sp.]|nr:hypothetical protein [Bacteroides sp.]MDE6825569.1 hypothetical protein [Paramuribaculum sp.]